MPTVKTSMTDKQYEKCQYIIHSAATAAAGGHIIPGVGQAGDLATMTAMTISLLSVFGTAGDSVSDTASTVAKKQLETLAMGMVKKALREFAASIVIGGIADFIPGIGTVVSGSLAVRKIEKVGWKIAVDLYEQNTGCFRKFWNGIWYGREINY